MEGRQKAVAMSNEQKPAKGKRVQDQLGKSGDALAQLDRSVLSTLAGLGKQLETEGCCPKGTGDGRLWELLGVALALIEFHARYRGGGAGTPFGTPEGIRRMLDRQIALAFGQEGGKK